MTSNTIANGIIKSVLTLAALVLLGFVLFKLSSVLVYLIVSLLFVMLIQPVITFLQVKLKFKKIIAIITSLFFTVFLMYGFVQMFIPLILSQSESLSLLDINSLEQNSKVLLNNIDAYLQNRNINIIQLLEKSNIAHNLNFNFIPNLINGIIDALSSFGIGFLAVFFISFFLLKDKESINNGFRALLPENQKDTIKGALDKIEELLRRYFLGILLQLLIIFILELIVFSIFGVKNAFIIALLCAVLNIIPFIGPLLAMVVASVLIMISGIGGDFVHTTLPTVGYVLIGMLIIQLIDNNLNQPIIFSKSTKSHPLEIFLVIISVGILFGIVGMIVAIPAYTVIKVIGKSFFPNLKITKVLTKEI